MRLFVAVVPPDAVLDAVAALHRPARPGVRWASRPQWHVTLRFLGEVADPAPIATALDAASLRPTEAVLGPKVETLFPGVVGLRVAGLDDLAAGVAAALAEAGLPPDPRPFRGHLTLARLDRRRGKPRPKPVTGEAFAARFPVDEVRLVHSQLGRDGPRYEDLHARPLKA